MSEVGDEVGEGPHVTQRVVPDVSPDVSTSTDYGYISDKYEDDDYETLIAKLKEHLKDTLASDIQLSLFVAACSSYRQDSALRPFPPMFLSDDNQTKDIESLTSILKQLPSLKVIQQNLKYGKLDLDLKLLKLIVWILNGGNSNLKLRTLSDDEKKSLESLKEIEKQPHPHYILEVSNQATLRWLKNIENKKTYWAFHGSRLDNFYSILNYGLQQHLNKTGLFGEGIYLAQDLGVCLSYSSQGVAWSDSALGSNLSCVAVTQVMDHPSVKMFSEDQERGRVEGSVGGRVPDKYMVVRNNELLHIRYLLVYKHGSSGASASSGYTNLLATFIADNKLLFLHLTYILMLALIGFSNSPWLQRWLRKYGWID